VILAQTSHDLVAKAVSFIRHLVANQSK